MAQRPQIRIKPAASVLILVLSHLFNRCTISYSLSFSLPNFVHFWNHPLHTGSQPLEFAELFRTQQGDRLRGQCGPKCPAFIELTALSPFWQTAKIHKGIMGYLAALAHSHPHPHPAQQSFISNIQLRKCREMYMDPFKCAATDLFFILIKLHHFILYTNSIPYRYTVKHYVHELLQDALESNSKIQNEPEFSVWSNRDSRQ